MNNPAPGTIIKYYLIQTLRQCSSNPDSITVKINQNPAPDISGLLNYYCDQYADVPFTVSDLNAGLGSVVAEDTIKIDGINQSVPLFKTNLFAPGFHYVNYSINNTVNCFAEITDTVEIKALPVLSISGLDTAGYCQDYIDSASAVNIPVTGGQYWHFRLF